MCSPPIRWSANPVSSPPTIGHTHSGSGRARWAVRLGKRLRDPRRSKMMSKRKATSVRPQFITIGLYRNHRTSRVSLRSPGWLPHLGQSRIHTPVGEQASLAAPHQPSLKCRCEVAWSGVWGTIVFGIQNSQSCLSLGKSMREARGHIHMRIRLINRFDQDGTCTCDRTTCTRLYFGFVRRLAAVHGGAQ